MIFGFLNRILDPIPDGLAICVIALEGLQIEVVGNSREAFASAEILVEMLENLLFRSCDVGFFLAGRRHVDVRALAVFEVDRPRIARLRHLVFRTHLERRIDELLELSNRLRDAVWRVGVADRDLAPARRPFLLDEQGGDADTRLVIPEIRDCRGDVGPAQPVRTGERELDLERLGIRHWVVDEAMSELAAVDVVGAPLLGLLAGMRIDLVALEDRPGMLIVFLDLDLESVALKASTDLREERELVIASVGAAVDDPLVVRVHRGMVHVVVVPLVLVFWFLVHFGLLLFGDLVA